MIQRTLLRASRTAASAAAASASRSPLLLRSSATPSPSSFVAARSAPSCLLRGAARWYSDSAKQQQQQQQQQQETKKEEDGEKAKAEEKKEGGNNEVEKQLEAAKKEIVELKDKYLRSVAEYRNLQERTKREVQAAKDFAIQRFAKDLIDTVDNLDRALSTVRPEALKENPDLATLHEGLAMTDRILLATLKKHGLERFDPSEANEKFNANLHEAVFMAPQPDKEDGACFHTQQKGFLLNGRVLRAAKVGVVKNA